VEAALVVSALLLGLAGSPHCAAMCGPIHLFLARAGGRGLWAYHVGRVITYGGIGALAGVLLSRNQDVVLPAGTHVEMILDRDLVFHPGEIADLPR